MGKKFVVATSWEKKRKEAGGYKRVAGGIFVMELFCIWTVVSGYMNPYM